MLALQSGPFGALLHRQHPKLPRSDSDYTTYQALFGQSLVGREQIRDTHPRAAGVYIGVSKVSPPKTTQLEERHLGVFYPDYGRGTSSIWTILLGLLARLGARQDLEDDP